MFYYYRVRFFFIVFFCIIGDLNIYFFKLLSIYFDVVVLNFYKYFLRYYLVFVVVFFGDCVIFFFRVVICFGGIIVLCLFLVFY